MFKPFAAILSVVILLGVFIIYRRSSRNLPGPSETSVAAQGDALPPAYIPGRLPEICETPWCEEVLDEKDGICDQCELRHCKVHLYDYDFIEQWGSLQEYTEYPRHARLCEDCVAEIEDGFNALAEREREGAM